MLRPRLNIFAVFAVCLLNCGCELIEAPPPRHRTYVRLAGPPAKNLTRTCEAAYRSDWDYFPEKTAFHHSSQLQVTYRQSFKVVHFISGVHRNQALEYVLYQCGTPRPSGFEDAIFIEVPAERAVLNIAAFGSTVDRLGVIDRFYGVNGFEGYTNAAILQAIHDGRLHEMGSRGPSTIENALAFDPDLVFLFYSGNPIFNLHPALYRLGVGAAALADIFEATPLGRAEWMKFMALFFNEEAQANRLFEDAAGRYHALAERVRRTRARPLALEGFAANRDTWTAVGGRNNIAKLIEDAGAHYFLDDDVQAKANLPMPFERALQRSMGARVWIGINGVVRIKTKYDLVQNAPQVAELGPIRNGNVYALDLHLDKNRSYPYSDESLDKPDVMLADFVSIFHPELLPGYQPSFIRKLQ
jgi:iron complex transport system substrate-binding protein